MTTGRVETKDWIPNPDNAHVLKIDGPELANFEDGASDEDITEKLRGLGYIS